MNRKQLRNLLADRSGAPLGLVDRIMSELFGTRARPGLLEDMTIRGETIRLLGFGTFDAPTAAGRPGGRNIATGAASPPRPPRRSLRFRSGRTLASRMA